MSRQVRRRRGLLTQALAILVVTGLGFELAVRVLDLDDRLVERALFAVAAPGLHRASVDPFLHYELRPGVTWRGVGGEPQPVP